VVSRTEEQAWNACQLLVPVTRPARQLWVYRKPAVVLGRSQSRTVCAKDVHRRTDVDVVERQSGGGAVLVGPWMLSASVVLPAAHPLVSKGVTSSYKWIGEAYASVLRQMGIAARSLTPEQVMPARQHDTGIDWACFGSLSPWEVVVAGRKILGLAQTRRRTGVLLVAGLLLDRPDWSLLCRAMGKPAQSADLLVEKTTSCAEEFGGPLPRLELAYRVGTALREAMTWPTQDSGWKRHDVIPAFA